MNRMAMLFQQNWLNKSLGSPAVHFNLSFLAFEILVRQILFDKTPRHHRFFRIWIGCEFRKQISYILCKNTLHDRDLNH